MPRPNRQPARRAQNLVEYSLVIALVAVIAIGALVGLGGALGAQFDSISNSVGGPTATPTAAPTAAPAPAVVSNPTPVAGTSVTISGTGFAPSSPVQVVIYSTPQVLATVNAGATGAVSATVTIPVYLVGAHTLALDGIDPTAVVRNQIASITVVPPPTVSTLAGSGVGGSADGTGTAAQFNYPFGLAYGPDGNLYVSDQGNNKIRKVTPAGVVSTFAGSGVEAFADGPGTAAQFAFPYGLAFDATGDLYVADGNNHRIRKITPAGVVSTFAGSGVEAFADGDPATAEFSSPFGLAFDSTGNLYVADMNNHRIRKITPAGVVSTFAGSGVAGVADGPGMAAQFNSPAGLVYGSDGDLYVADSGNHQIRKITPDGVVSTLAGSGVFGFADGDPSTAQFDYPFGLAFDATGNLYVADVVNNRIRVVSPAGVVSTMAGSGVAGFADGVSSTAQFDGPFGLAFDATGNLYVADSYNHRIRKITPTADLVTAMPWHISGPWHRASTGRAWM